VKPPKPGGHCEVDLQHWSRYLEGEFSSVTCRRCETHLAGCPACRAKLKALGWTIRACRTAAARAKMPAAVKARARARVKRLLRGTGSRL
jgi:predicted anti-sigma-YlaC factor YlaD